MKNSFGLLPDGREASVWTLENENIRMSVTDFGAALVSLIDKKTGVDAVQGFDSVQGYYDSRGTCFGASIGRTANRTAKGVFELNGKTYQLFINNNGNSLHGGEYGFDRKLFDGREEEDCVVFTRLCPDGEENYPGNLEVKIIYRLLDDGVAIHTEGTADQDTLFAYTNHSYFNLDHSGTVLHHRLRLPAEKYALSDENGLMQEIPADVEGTPFDFRQFHEIGERIEEDDQQLKYGNGYDHFYLIDGDGMRTMAVLEAGGMQLCVESDYPGIQIYTANFFEGFEGKYNEHYGKRSSIALEASYMPNAINYDSAIKPIVRAGETQVHEIRFRLKSR